MRHHRAILLLLILCCFAFIKETEQRVRQQVAAMMTVVGDRYALAAHWGTLTNSAQPTASSDTLASMLDN